ncbi:unnamed protein product [Withania somnifera]
MTRIRRCGFPEMLRFLLSNDNHRRRFWGCKNYKVSDQSSCNFFYWYEPSFPRQANFVIRGLLKKRNKHDQELKWMRTLKICLCINVL